MNIKCPHCGTDYEVEEKDMYRYTKCEVCGKGFVIGATKSLQKVDGGGSEEEEQKKKPTLGIRRPSHQTSQKAAIMDDKLCAAINYQLSAKAIETPKRVVMAAEERVKTFEEMRCKNARQNIRYEELVAMNRVAYEQRKKKERQAALIKYSVYTVLFALCCTGSYIVWNKYEARKKRESALAAEEDRRIEEAAYRKAEEQRIATEEAARKRTEKKLALERRLEVERLAREKQREEERLAWERKCEAERLARERERQEREEKLAADRRRKEEERKAAQQAREAKRLLDERKREEERLAKDVESRRQQESQKKSRVIEERRVYVGKTPQTVSKQSSVDKKYEFDFFAARRGMGGSVLEALVRKLNGSITDDKMSHTSARTARATAMMSIAGTIGPIEYERQIRTKRTTSTQAIGGFQGYADGEVVSGTVYGPVGSIKEKVGGYVAKVPTGFRKAFDQMMSVARRGHSRANAEAGACIFVDATKGQIGMDERKALAMFTKAADLGDADGMYMQAFCLFYGIGKKDVHKAYRILLIWREQVASETLRNSGWARRRLDEAQQLGY